MKPNLLKMAFRHFSAGRFLFVTPPPGTLNRKEAAVVRHREIHELYRGAAQ